jgi:DNA-binding transcriptional LysR family regulator
MTKFTLRQLEYFIAAADAESMTEAALSLPLSQSALSSAIAQLERSLGVQLFMRHHARGLTLTAAGAAILGGARRLLAQADDLESTASDLGTGLSGRLVVGCFSTIAPLVLPRVFEEFAHIYPEVRVEHFEADFDVLERRLLEGTCEVAIVYDHGLSSQIAREVLFDFRPYALLAADHPLIGRTSISLRELALTDDPMILLDVPYGRDYYRLLFASVGVEPNIRYGTSTPAMVHSLVGRGLGFSVLNSPLPAELSVDGRRLVTVPLNDDVPPLTLVLAYPLGARLTRRAEAFLDRCRAAVRDQPGILSDYETRIQSSKWR